MTKLVEVADQDGALLSRSDLDVLQRLRRARNDISHGRTKTIPGHADLRKGTAIASRLLRIRLTAMARAEADHQTDDQGNSTSKGSSEGTLNKGGITENEKRYALKTAEATALMMPFLERGALIPGSVQAEMRAIYADSTEESLVVGTMVACDVALKHLAKHFLGGSLLDAASVASSMIDRMRSDDIAGLGLQAYVDGGRAVHLMANAMASRGTLNLLDEFETSNRVLLAFDSVLIALLFELAGRYDIAPSSAANQLGREISTIRPPS